MMLSCVIRQLDYIWHGFHFTNMIPYRFSYLISFVIVVMAYRAFMLIDFTTCWDVILAVLFSAVIILIAIDTQETYAIVGTAVIAALVCIVLSSIQKNYSKAGAFDYTCGHSRGRKRCYRIYRC